MPGPAQDIGEALQRLRMAFKRHDLEPPDVLEFSKPEDAVAAKRVIYGDPDIQTYLVQTHDATVMFETQIVGFKIR